MKTKCLWPQLSAQIKIISQSPNYQVDYRENVFGHITAAQRKKADFRAVSSGSTSMLAFRVRDKAADYYHYHYYFCL